MLKSSRELTEDKEVWEFVEESNSNYKISNLGRLKSIERNVSYINRHGSVSYRFVPEKIISTHLDKDGYECATIYTENSKRSPVKIHRLVAIAFIDNPNNLPQVNHEDGIKTNNKWNNLTWTDNRGNQTHRKIVLGDSTLPIGVSYVKSRGIYRTRITINKVVYCIYYGKNIKEAGESYQKALKNWEENKKLPYKKCK